MIWMDEKLVQISLLSKKVSDLTKKATLANASRDQRKTEDLVNQLAISSEALTLCIRGAVTYKPHKIAKFDCDGVYTGNWTWDIHRAKNGWWRIICPRLLPAKKRGNVKWLKSSLYAAMEDYFGRYQDESEKISPAVIICRTVYPQSTPERYWTDHDNMEFSEAQDIIAQYLMPTDKPSHCSNYFCSVCGEGDQERTEFYVIPAADFPKWLRWSNGKK